MKIVVSKFGSHEDWPVLVENKTFLGASPSNNSFKLWHECVWCLHLAMILKMFRENMVTNIKLGEKKEKAKLCESCVYGKSHWLPFLENDKTSRAKNLEFFFQFDVCGPMSIPSLGNTIFLCCSLMIWTISNLFISHKKKEVSQCYKKMKIENLRTVGNLIVKFKNNNGGEYANCVFKEFLVEVGTKDETSILYCPQ